VIPEHSDQQADSHEQERHGEALKDPHDEFAAGKEGISVMLGNGGKLWHAHRTMDNARLKPRFTP